jgi:hypothetical protein
LNFKFLVVQIESYEEMTNIRTVDLEELLIVHIHAFPVGALRCPKFRFGVLKNSNFNSTN